MSEKDCVCDAKIYILQYHKFLHVYLVAHETILFIEQGLFTKYIIHSKMHNFCSIGRIFTGWIEEAFRNPHVKYLSDWMIFKFFHELAYNYRYTQILTILSGL